MSKDGYFELVKTKYFNGINVTEINYIYYNTLIYLFETQGVLVTQKMFLIYCGIRLRGENTKPLGIVLNGTNYTCPVNNIFEKINLMFHL